MNDVNVGVIGLGNVGSEVAKRAHGLEMEVVAYDPVVSVERAELFNVELVSLNELLEPLRAELRRRVFITDLDAVDVVSAELGIWAGAIGAAVHGASAVPAVG